MSGCPQQKDRLFDYVLGALPLPAVQELEQHLRDCPSCARALEEIRTSNERIGTVLPEMVRGVEPPAAFRAKVLADIETRRGPALLRPAWIGALAVLAILLLAGVFLRPLARRWIHPRTLDVTALSRWRSPTASLLRSPSEELLRPKPQVGAFFFPLRTIPSGAHKKTGGNDES